MQQGPYPPGEERITASGFLLKEKPQSLHPFPLSLLLFRSNISVETEAQRNKLLILTLTKK